MFEQEYIELFTRAWLILTKAIVPSVLPTIILAGIITFFKKTTFTSKGTDFLVLAIAVLFGSVIGFFTGASRDPVVGTILPIVISLIIIYVGYMSSKEVENNVKEIIPFCIVLFILSTWFSALYGMGMRLDWGAIE